MQIDPENDSLSYWHSTQEPMIPNDELPRTADVVVIGAGMLGCWTAYWLAKQGNSVVVLEKSAIGWGATGRNGGFLTGGGAIGYSQMIERLGRENAARLYALSMEGQELAHTVIHEEGIDCDLRRTGTLGLALSEDDLDGMRRQQQLLAEDGFTKDILDRAELQAKIQTTLADEIVGAAYAPTGGLLHSSRYLAGLAQAAKKHGALFVRAGAESITGNADSASVHTSAGNIDAGRVVVALNAWTDTLIPEMKGVIVPMRGQILAYEPIRPVFSSAIGTDITPTGEYWQQTPDGSIIIGGCRADAPGKDLDVRDMVSTPEVIANIDQVLPRLFPQLSDLKIARTWAGLMAYTADGLPIVDQAEESVAVWYGGGFNGHGMPFGPILGRLLADSVTEPTPARDLAMLGKDRPSLNDKA